MSEQTALDWLVSRCNEMDITEQLNWLGDATRPYRAQKELAALRAELDAVKTERDEVLKKTLQLIDDIGGYVGYFAEAIDAESGDIVAYQELQAIQQEYLNKLAALEQSK